MKYQNEGMCLKQLCSYKTFNEYIVDIIQGKDVSRYKDIVATCINSILSYHEPKQQDVLGCLAENIGCLQA